MKKYTINQALFDSYMDSMNFLNEISIDYPNAISFGSGRPNENYFNVQEIVEGLNNVEDDENSNIKFYNNLGQYNKTKGIINEEICKLIQNDENIDVSPEDILVTDGAQEGMAIILNSLINSDDDVVLVSEPSYVGFVGYAKISRVQIHAIERDEDSICLVTLESKIKQLQAAGKKVKILYDNPDFHNPTGGYMQLEKREKLIELAEKYNFYIVEDNPYGYFRYENSKIPTLKALDRFKKVIYLGSFSKTIFPSMRLGYLVVNQDIKSETGTVKLIEEFKKTKSFITVNSSAILQAMAGSYLRKNNYSLVKACEAKVSACKTNRDVMLNALQKELSGIQLNNKELSWSIPEGGYFLVVTLPFELDNEKLLSCVQEYNVIFCPMYFFCLDSTQYRNKIRLAFSNLSKEDIKKGIAQLADFIKNQIY